MRRKYNEDGPIYFVQGLRGSEIVDHQILLFTYYVPEEESN